jgi:hypothetical protein
MAAPRFLADEEFRFDIVLAVRGRSSGADIATVHELALDGTEDADLLEWAAMADRIVLSHDRNTMTAAAAQRLRSGASFSGLIIVPQHAHRASVAEDIVLIASCSDSAEWGNVIEYLPWPRST